MDVLLEWGTQVEEDILGCCGRHLQTWGVTVAHVTLLAFVYCFTYWSP